MSKLTFTEELTGWDVGFVNRHGTAPLGRLEYTDDRFGWRFIAQVASEQHPPSFSLPELDQIRHKLANLEATRLAKIELQEMKDGN